MYLFHKTGIYQAIAIIRTGRFIPKSMYSRDADSGLNCYDSRSGYRQNIHEDTGATVRLKWEGAAPLVVGPNASPPYQQAVLLDMHPWRMFVPAPLTGVVLLRISHVRFRSADVAELLEESSSFWWVPAPMRRAIHRRRRLEFWRELRRLYRARDCWISIQ